MNTILHLNSSIFGEGGQSSRLAEQFVARFPAARVLRRDAHSASLRVEVRESGPDARLCYVATTRVG